MTFPPSRLKTIKMGCEDLSSEEKPFFFNELLRNVETSKQEIETTLKKEKNARGKPLNPVANFHLANGATISKKHINFLGIAH